MKNLDDSTEEELVGFYVLCDGGYHKWRTMQCPVKYTSDPLLCQWSRWLESVRKDIESTFGILKGRFRILKLPLLLQSAEEIDNVFYTCCALHNEILRSDNLSRLWEQGFEWDKGHGYHDLCDIDKTIDVNRMVADKMQRLSVRVSRTFICQI